MKKQLFNLFVAVIPTGLFLSGFTNIDAQDTALGNASAKASIEYLKKVMDQYHTAFDVYKDVSSPGNHFHVYAKIPNGDAPVEINGSDSSYDTQRGATVIKCTFMKDQSNLQGGYYFQNGVLPAATSTPIANFGTEPNTGIDLTGAVSLSFWAKGEKGGEKIEFFMGGVGRKAETGNTLPDFPYPDSSPRYPVFGTAPVVLTTQWQRFTIPFPANWDFSYVLGGFAWYATLTNNPNGATFYLDDIQYELNDSARNARLNQPRFLRSFTTLPGQPNPNDSNKDDDFDLVLRNTAFSYDNALALLALLLEFDTFLS